MMEAAVRPCVLLCLFVCRVPPSPPLDPSAARPRTQPCRVPGRRRRRIPSVPRSPGMQSISSHLMSDSDPAIMHAFNLPAKPIQLELATGQDDDDGPAVCSHGMHETGTGSYTREITHSIDLLFCSMSVCRPAGTVFHSPHARIYTQVMVILMVIVAGSIPFPHACAGSIGFLLSLLSSGSFHCGP